MSDPSATLMPLGDSALLVRFASHFDMEANAAAIALAEQLKAAPPSGVVEVASNLISVLLRYDPATIGFSTLAGELRMRLSMPVSKNASKSTRHRITVRFGGEGGPDLPEVAEKLGLSVAGFINAHNVRPLRVLATGFAPGFVYCGMHAQAPHLPRRQEVRPKVPRGAILFAAGQTAITASPIPTGWYVIGRTDFKNFDPNRDPPTLLRPGDEIVFEAAK